MNKQITANLNILLAEDDKGHAALLTRNLWRTCIDANIIHFSNGNELLAYLEGESILSETFKPGKYILLLDIKMPGLNGVEVLKNIKNQEAISPIPVIMITTTNNPEEIEICYHEGCSFYIVKPSDYVQFMEAIQNLGEFLSLTSLLIPAIHAPTSSRH
jgi:CheY-like chemotaxis protein